MGAFEKANKLSREEVMAKITSEGIMEYGMYADTLSNRIAHALRDNREYHVPMQVVVALHNSDTKGVLLDLLKEEMDSVLEGIQILSYALHAEKMILYIPEYAGDLVEQVSAAAKEEGIEVLTGMVNERTYKGCLLAHIVTVKELADCFLGTAKDGTYISVNGGKLAKISNDTKIAELIAAEDVKAIQMGYTLHRPEDRELTVGNAGIINGVLNVLTSQDCIITEVEKELLASRKQSCGRCVFCREGLIQLEGMEKDIANGKGKQEYTDLIKEIGSAMRYSTPCSMGQISSQIVLSSVENFRDEYDEHIKKKQCPAGICTSFITIYIDPHKCEGCEECAGVCPADCIEGKSGFIHMIDDFDCTKCGKCIEACEYDAVIQTAGKVPKLPNKLTKCGKFKKH